MDTRRLEHAEMERKKCHALRLLFEYVYVLTGDYRVSNLSIC